MLKRYALFKIIEGLREQREYSVRGLAKKAKLGVSTTKIYLDYLFSKGLVKKKIVGRSHLYSSDLSSFLARYMKILLSLMEINDSSVVKELASRYPISSIVLYGSVSRGEDDENSDIDLLVITRKKVRITLLKSEKRLKRELTILAYTLPEWRRKSKEDKVFYDRIIVDGIPLYGEIPIIS